MLRLITLTAVAMLLFTYGAAAAEITPYGTLNYKYSHDENSSGVAYDKLENNGSKIGIDIIEPSIEGSSLSGIAKKSVKEAEYHFEHSSGWINMLGNSTEKARLKTQDAIDYLSPYTNEFFVDDEIEKILNINAKSQTTPNFL